MAKVAEGVGKTYDEAVEEALSKVGLTKNQVSIEMIEEPKKRIFSILDPRQVKVRVTEIVTEVETPTYTKKEEREFSKEDAKKVEEKVYKFLREYFEKMELELSIKSSVEEDALKFDITGENTGIIIGRRGETLEALQLLASTIGNKNEDNFVRVIIDIEGYRRKRIKALEELALKRATLVVSKKKSITLEPMNAFERKAIHNALQNHPKVKTISTGEEPYRKVIISLR